MNFLNTLRKTAKKIKTFLFSEKSQKGFFRKSKSTLLKVEVNPVPKIKRKVNDKKTHPGGVAARGGSFARFGCCSLMPFIWLLWAFVRVGGVLILSAAFVALWAFCGVLRG